MIKLYSNYDQSLGSIDNYLMRSSILYNCSFNNNTARNSWRKRWERQV
jgi:hypothetical protein